MLLSKEERRAAAIYEATSELYRAAEATVCPLGGDPRGQYSATDSPQRGPNPKMQNIPLAAGRTGILRAAELL